MTPSVKKGAAQFPIVTLTGPRQSGKTTLAKMLFPDKTYVNLEPLATRLRIQADPWQFLNAHPDGAIIDEIQHLPELLTYIQAIVDKHDIPGEFILTGSHQVALQGAITQSLAGRTSMLRLLPMSQPELKDAGIIQTLDQHIYHGGYPRLYTRDIEPPDFFNSYCQTYLERDVRSMVKVGNLMQFQKFMHLCASRVGQIVVYTSLANDLGVSVQTVKEWLSILEASFIIYQLPPYFENIGKRLIKSPKLYFLDTGLATYLLDIEFEKQLSRHPMRGALVENFVILELLKARYNNGRDPHFYFYRDNHQNEVDVIFKTGEHLIPIEIKSSETFHVDFLKGLKRFKSSVPDQVSYGYVVYAGNEEFELDGFRVINYKNTSKITENL